MQMSEKKKGQNICLLDLMDTYPNGLLVPEIQRDYVMGASIDKLDSLFEAMKTSFEQDEYFHFSSIITYHNEKTGYLEIYDGQQRLTTLFLLFLYCIHQEHINNSMNENSDVGMAWGIVQSKSNEQLQWFSFRKRTHANDLINSLTDKLMENEELDALVDSMEVKDFTSFSINNLLIKFREFNQNTSITCEFLLKNVVFDQVEIESQSEIEQFFMDLNAGVKMKEYELYKAKLVDHIVTLRKQTENNEILTKWLFKIDNEWLDAFMPFANYEHPAEEYEIAFLKYCFKMLLKEKENDWSSDLSLDDFSKLKVDILEQCYSIMCGVTDLKFSCEGDSDEPQMIEFAWVFQYGKKKNVQIICLR